MEDSATVIVAGGNYTPHGRMLGCLALDYYVEDTGSYRSWLILYYVPPTFNSLSSDKI
jgi:hypothetical protein